jgi:hypothetical protein
LPHVTAGAEVSGQERVIRMSASLVIFVGLLLISVTMLPAQEAGAINLPLRATQHKESKNFSLCHKKSSPLFAFFLPFGNEPVPVDLTGVDSTSKLILSAIAALALPEKLGVAVTLMDLEVFIISRKEALRIAENDANVVLQKDKGSPIDAMSHISDLELCEGNCLLLEFSRNFTVHMLQVLPSPSNTSELLLPVSSASLANDAPVSPLPTLYSASPDAKFPLHIGLSGSTWMTKEDVHSIELEFKAEQTASLEPAKAGVWVEDKIGIHRPSSPLVTGDGFSVAADVRCVSDETCRFDASAWANAHPGLAIVIYSRQDAVKRFIALALPQLRNAQLQFVFITHNSDFSAPHDETDATLLSEPLLIKWFGTNPGRKHPKLSILPCGFMNRYISNIGEYPEKIIAYRRKAASTPPTHYVLSSFSTETNVGVRVPLIATIEKAFGANSTRFSAKNIEEWYAAVVDHQMVVSPRGNGLDTHRTWEILTLGRVPVVETSLLDPLFEGLPVLILEKWSDLLRPDDIHQRYLTIAAKIYAGDFSSNRVWLTYYVCEIFLAAGRGHEHGCPK